MWIISSGLDVRNHAVQPNETVTYFWTMARSDGPTGSDLGCLTRFYFSNVDMDRDLASGLIGPLLICAKNMLDSYARLVRNSFFNKWPLSIHCLQAFVDIYRVVASITKVT